VSAERILRTNSLEGPSFPIRRDTYNGISDLATLFDLNPPFLPGWKNGDERSSAARNQHRRRPDAGHRRSRHRHKKKTRVITERIAICSN